MRLGKLSDGLARTPFSGTLLPRTLFVYLEGRRREMQGDLPEARHWYDLAVRTDPTRFWPSVLADRRLRSLDEAEPR